jgi:DeoR/GlpR family transcriptional regulator of sugar metabolism
METMLGGTPVAVSTALCADEIAYPSRAVKAGEAQARIGRAVADLIAEGETKVLDRGTIPAALANRLRVTPR